MQTQFRRRNRNEVLFNNWVDNEFSRIMLPLNVIQQITFMQKYRIRDKFITPNDNITNLVAFCILNCIIAFNWYQYLVTEYNVHYSQLLHIATCILEPVYEPIVLVINFAYVVRYSNDNVTLFLKLQRIAIFTKCSRYRDVTILNWVGAVGFLGYHGSVLIIMLVQHNFIAWAQIIQLLINLNIFYTCRFVNLLRKGLVLWTDKILQLEHNIRVKSEEETEIIENCAELFNCFRNILEAFSIVKRTLECMVRKIIAI